MSLTDSRNTTDKPDTVADQSAKGHPVATLSVCDPQTSSAPDRDHDAVAGARPPRDDVDALVSAAITGDRAAIEGVLRSIRPLVVRYCRARIGGQEKLLASVDDVAQEVCLAVLTALPGYRNQGRPFLAFVYGIAAHKVADARRTAARNRAEPVAEVPEMLEETDGPEAQLMQGELAERLGELLDILPDKQREVLLLRVVVGLSAETTAAAVGSSPGAVRVAQHRALSRLRKVLTSKNRSPDGVKAPIRSTAVSDKITGHLERLQLPGHVACLHQMT
jgi:RNA polymerase sigma-70 factor (ECF subfamily)